MATVSVNATDLPADRATPEALPSVSPIVVDLGKRSRKKVRRLRRGKGPLMSEADAILAELREGGRIDGNAQVVILVVKQKRKRSKRFLRGML